VIGLCIESGVDDLEVFNIVGNVVLICSGMIITCCVHTSQINSGYKIYCVVTNSAKIKGNITLWTGHFPEADQGNWKINCSKGMPLICLGCAGCLLTEIARN